MMPPVGVQASVLSSDTIKVTWADNSLPKNQKITDNRFYTVRWKTNIPANTKVKVRVVAAALGECRSTRRTGEPPGADFFFSQSL